MLTLYLACLVFGGALLAFTLFLGGDHSSDADVSFGGDAELDSGADALSDVNIDHSTELQEASSHAVEGVKILSFSNTIYFLTFFGLAGTVFNWLEIAMIPTLLLSVGLGTFSSFTGYKFMKYLKGSESGEAINIYSLKGKTGIVILPISKDKKGKILLEAGGKTMHLTALVSETDKNIEIKNKEHILIIDVIDNIAICIKTDL